jgi:hypothetical protein
MYEAVVTELPDAETKNHSLKDGGSRGQVTQIWDRGLALQRSSVQTIRMFTRLQLVIPEY